jgi:signal transduction histidine kinase
MVDHLRFSPDILRRLGEELVPDIDQGIIELVKNAYDADATVCTVDLREIASGKGSIQISDNGSGMTEKDIRDGWLVIGRSGKKQKALTSVFHRVAVGDKGLGRLAALRLGRKVTLKTSSISQPSSSHQLKIDWEEFDRAKTVEDVPLKVQTSKLSRLPGTEILIEGIAAKLSKTTVNRLARSLILLSDPFAKLERQNAIKTSTKSGRKVDPGFAAVLHTPEYKDLQAKVGKSYFDDAEYRICAELNDAGKAIFKILDWRGETLHELEQKEIYDSIPFRFDLWVFLLKGESFSTRKSTVGEVRDWLSTMGGVHIYEDGIRVPPYGGAGNDWLEINLRRARSPEVRPSTNTSVGRVKFSNANRAFVQKTDRVGYIENAPFLALRRCCGDALDWAARVLVRDRDDKRRQERARREQKSAKATKSLEIVLSKTVPTTERKKVEDAIATYVKETEKEAKSLRDELQLYRSLATAGMTSAVFAHEIGRPLKLIDDAMKSLLRMIPADEKEKAQNKLDRVRTQKEKLNSFVSIPLRLLSKEKRRIGKIDINQCVTKLAALLAPICDYYKVSLKLVLTEKYSAVRGSEALIDGVVLNFILNSIAAFQRENFHQQDRKIEVMTDYDGRDVSISVQDNAGGIDGITVDDVWLPGATTAPDGTGFGLTIVRDSVQDLGGEVEVQPLTERGGALFVVSIPAMRDLF